MPVGEIDGAGETDLFSLIETGCFYELLDGAAFYSDREQRLRLDNPGVALLPRRRRCAPGLQLPDLRRTGAGASAHQGRLHMRPDWENVVAPVVDYALSRPEVDPERVSLVGWSFGGYLAPRGLGRTPPGCLHS